MNEIVHRQSLSIARSEAETGFRWMKSMRKTHLYRELRYERTCHLLWRTLCCQLHVSVVKSLVTDDREQFGSFAPTRWTWYASLKSNSALTHISARLIYSYAYF